MVKKKEKQMISKKETQVNDSLQRKVVKQREELTKAYERLAQQKETIKNLCRIRDKSKLMFLYLKGVESNVNVESTNDFEELEELLFPERFL